MSISIEYFGMLDDMGTDLGLFETDPLIQEPISAIKYLSKKEKLKSFMCPALNDYLKNVYYIPSPLDFTIERDGNKARIINDKDHRSDISRFLFVSYPDPIPLDGVPMITLHLQYIFVNNGDDITMEVIDPPLIPKLLTNVCGEFNISKWIRPTNFSFYLHPECNSVTFKRGEPLYAVKFRTKKNINLLEITDDERRKKILTEQQKAISIKKWYPNIQLNDAYDMFKRRMKSIWK